MECTRGLCSVAAAWGAAWIVGCSVWRDGDCARCLSPALGAAPLCAVDTVGRAVGIPMLSSGDRRAGERLRRDAAMGQGMHCGDAVGRRTGAQARVWFISVHPEHKLMSSALLLSHHLPLN